MEIFKDSMVQLHLSFGGSSLRQVTMDFCILSWLFRHLSTFSNSIHICLTLQAKLRTEQVMRIIYFEANSHHVLVLGSAFIIFVGFLNWIPTIWINLIPSLILWFPFLQKIRKMKYDPYYLTRFEVTNYLYVLLWLVREIFFKEKLTPLGLWLYLSQKFLSFWSALDLDLYFSRKHSFPST